jgi:dynein heavy chain
MIKLFNNCEQLISKQQRNLYLATGMVSSESESSDFIGMCVLMVGQIWWTYEVEDAFRQVHSGNKLAMKQMRQKLMDQITDIVALVRSNLDRLMRKKINTLIIVDVHSRDLVDGFVRDSILDVREFQWESQLRYYWDRAADDVVVRQCTGTFYSGYEYMGLNGRLVITPLTDRCIMTLTQALSIGFGGLPAGPASTGKTETVKDLAKAMCRLCVVFNCGEGLDHKSMGRIFSGLVQIAGGAASTSSTASSRRCSPSSPGRSASSRPRSRRASGSSSSRGRRFR